MNGNVIPNWYFLQYSYNIYRINLVQIHERGSSFGHEHGKITGLKGSNTEECTCAYDFQFSSTNF